MTISQLNDVQFEWNKNQFVAKETDYSHREMGWVNNSTNILNIWCQIVYFFLTQPVVENKNISFNFWVVISLWKFVSHVTKEGHQ